MDKQNAADGEAGTADKTGFDELVDNTNPSAEKISPNVNPPYQPDLGTTLDPNQVYPGQHSQFSPVQGQMPMPMAGAQPMMAPDGTQFQQFPPVPGQMQYPPYQGQQMMPPSDGQQMMMPPAGVPQPMPQMQNPAIGQPVMPPAQYGQPYMPPNPDYPQAPGMMPPANGAQVSDQTQQPMAPPEANQYKQDEWYVPGGGTDKQGQENIFDPDAGEGQQHYVQEESEEQTYWQKNWHVILGISVYVVAVIIGIVVIILSCKDDAVTDELNKQDGTISKGMSRVVIQPRADLQEKALWNQVMYVEENAIQWSECEFDWYWHEEGKIRLSQQADQTMMAATFKMHSMILNAVDKVIKDDKLLTLFNINKQLWPAIRYSWDTNQVDMQGRFDWIYDGEGQPKMLEYNADTPSMIIESGSLQEGWFRDTNQAQQGYQSNYVEQALNQAMADFASQCPSAAFIFMSVDDENVSQMNYLKKVYTQYSSNTVTQTVVQDLRVGYDESCKPQFILNDQVAECLFNVYPKEWLINEITQDGLLKYDFEKLRSIEPFWKLIAANKAMLPVLWSMYPGHPNLLPAYFDDPIGEEKIEDIPQDAKWVSKPLFGREGLGVFLSNNFTSHEEFVRTTESNFGFDNQTNEKLGKSIYQLYNALPVAQGRVIQASSWVIHGKPAGLSFREGKAGDNFGDLSPFLVHTVSRDAATPLTYDFKQTKEEYDIRQRIYGSAHHEQLTLLYQKNSGYANIFEPTYSDDYAPGEDVLFHSKPITEWAAYRNLTLVEDQNSTIDWVLSESVVNNLRKMKCCIEDTKGVVEGCPETAGRLLQSSVDGLSDTQVQEKFLSSPQNKDFTSRRQQRFGSIALSTLTIDQQSGGARWYSVDRTGYVRVHYWYTMGYGRTWGKG